MMTGVPASAISNTSRSTSFGSRTQPWDTAWPIEDGSFVPWMAIGPPWIHSCRTSENAEMPTAPGPHGPRGI